MRLAVLVCHLLLAPIILFAQDRSVSSQKFCQNKQVSCFEGHDAYFIGPTTLYRHGVLGDDVEWSGLILIAPDKSMNFLIGMTDEVFEDIAPRLADMDGDQIPEAIVVQSHPGKGAQLAVYSRKGKVATPYIGTRHRWLAPVGIADFNGDGDMDIAYIDRPHLAKTLRIVSYRNGKLEEVAKAANLTNHKIGWNFIAGGVRMCGQGPEMITADGGWANVMSTRMVGGKLVSKKIGTYKGPKSLAAALGC